LPDILHYNESLGLLDFTRAKVKLAIDMDARLPEINQDGEIKLVKALHPILTRFLKLENKKVIPLSLMLDKETRIMVISGPNAGGKSIALKTMGLLQIMLQSGLFIPVKEGSKMMIFEQIFVDIGDDQSIEYELSTYSSRLVKMKHFLRAADNDTLVFIDEFGTGSDPDLGGALAEVMLQDLMKSKPYGMITTHYNNIKVFAENNTGIINGSMLFERKSLKPLYKLEIGELGSSFTFEVASKIGLSNDLVDRAKHVVDNQKVNFDKVLVQLQARKNELNRKNNQLSKNQRQLSLELEKNREQFKILNEKLNSLKDKENQKLMEQGRKYVRLLEHWQKHKRKKELLKRIIIASEKLAENEKKEKIKDELHLLREKKKQRKEQRIKKRIDKKESTDQNWNPEPGDTIKIGKGRQTGTLIEIDTNKRKGLVHFGMMKTIVDIDKMVVVLKANRNG
jgi:DNA mismatch repair protein MutS2